LTTTFLPKGPVTFMTLHDLKLGEEKRENVWRRFLAWKTIDCNHGPNCKYLLVRAEVQWQELSERRNIFAILIQYSSTPGFSVSLDRPAHVLESDAISVATAFAEFIRTQGGAGDA
jgi:hypothetical protein